MSDFVKGIVKLARKYRASEQDALSAKTNQRFAVIKTAESNDAIVRRAIEHYAPEIIQFAKQYNIPTENYVFHHLKGTNTKHYIGTNAPQIKDKNVAKDVRFALMLNSSDEFERSMIKNYIKANRNRKTKNGEPITVQYLQELKKDVELQLNDCVILPKKFHDWLHHQEDKGDGKYIIKSTGEPYDASNRVFCYNLLNRYRYDNQRLSELINEDFDDASLLSSITSLKDLISLSSGPEQQNDAKDCIKKAYYTIKSIIVNHNIAQ